MFDLSSPDLAELDASFRETGSPLAGVDEAGRGPLAGPVVAAAVILDPNILYPGLNDSKKLKAGAREEAYELISTKAVCWAWEAIEAPEVDRLNPLGASLLAMERAVAKLAIAPALVLVDGNQTPSLPMSCRTLVKGDGRSLSIAAASIMAKVIRDRLMVGWHEVYPDYGFDRHKGYGTKIHLEALRLHGPCPLHRLTFRGVLQEPESPQQTSFLFPGDTCGDT